MATVPLSEALLRYKREVSIHKKGFPQEVFRIEQLVRELGHLLVSEVTSVDVATYRDKRLATLNAKTGKPISAGTVRLELSLLSNLFDISRIEWGYCDSNPVSNVRKPKIPPGRNRRLTAREERIILRHAAHLRNQELYSIVVLALETAMRQGEILALTWENISLRSRIAHLPETKNGTERDVPLSMVARDALIRMGTQTRGRVFTYTNAGLKSIWRHAVKTLGIEDLHFHDLRHEATSRLFELGTLDLMEIAAITGHKSLSMLKRYTHLKAQKLVRKLDSPRAKGVQVVMNYLVPYPARLQEEDGQIHVDLLDLGIRTTANNRSSALAAASDLLLHHLVCALRDSTRIPAPDQYLETVDESSIIMIDPMASRLSPTVCD